MEQQVKELFATLLQIPQETIHEGTSPGNLDRWDSLQHLILVSGFEEEFHVNIEPEEAVEMYKGFETFKRVILQKIEHRN